MGRSLLLLNQKYRSRMITVVLGDIDSFSDDVQSLFDPLHFLPSLPLVSLRSQLLPHPAARSETDRQQSVSALYNTVVDLKLDRWNLSTIDHCIVIALPTTTNYFLQSTLRRCTLGFASLTVIYRNPMIYRTSSRTINMKRLVGYECTIRKTVIYSTSWFTTLDLWSLSIFRVNQLDVALQRFDHARAIGLRVTFLIFYLSWIVGRICVKMGSFQLIELSICVSTQLYLRALFRFNQ